MAAYIFIYSIYTFIVKHRVSSLKRNFNCITLYFIELDTTIHGNSILCCCFKYSLCCLRCCQINYRGMNELPEEQWARVERRVEETTNKPRNAIAEILHKQSDDNRLQQQQQRQWQQPQNQRPRGSSNNVGRGGNNQRPFAPAEAMALTVSSADGGSGRRNTSERDVREAQENSFNWLRHFQT